MPSQQVFNELTKKGLNINTNRYNCYDTLETTDDLDELFCVLNSVRDSTNHPAVITPVTNVANPDFEKIKRSGFSEYYYEKFTDTLERYYQSKNVFKLWKQGIEAGIFTPELHGREHINVYLWLHKLREGNHDLLTAFDQGFIFLKVPSIPDPAAEFRAAFYFTSDDQKSFLITAIRESVELFHEIFGFLPRVFVPGNNMFHPDFDIVVAEAGVKYLYASHSMPYSVEGGALKHRGKIAGRRGPYDLVYYTRNCAFEPTDHNYKGIELTMRQVAAAFRWGKPANISTHRVNFAGGIDPGNRRKGLSELRKLLQAIITKWPDVEFMSSGDMLDYMSDNN